MNVRIAARAIAALFAVAAVGAALAESFPDSPDPLRQAAERGNPRSIEPGTFAIDPDSPLTMPPGMQPYSHDPDLAAANKAASQELAESTDSNDAPRATAGAPGNTNELRELATGRNGAVSDNELFARLDVNGDNHLTPADVRSVPALAEDFLQLDRNYDGVLTRTELADFDPLHPNLAVSDARDVIAGPPAASTAR